MLLKRKWRHIRLTGSLILGHLPKCIMAMLDWSERVCSPVSWTVTGELEKRTQAFEMRCYRRLLNISFKDHVTNEDVHRKIHAATVEKGELLTLVKKWKLRWFGHISRSSAIAKTNMQDTGKKKQR